MKKIISIVIFTLFGIIAYGQSKVYQDLSIQKTTPTLSFVGSGGIINFNSGDVTLTNSSNLITIAGGNLSLGTNSLLMSGSLAGTGSRVTKGWFTNIESTNLPTINGAAIRTLLMRSDKKYNILDYGATDGDAVADQAAIVAALVAAQGDGDFEAGSIGTVIIPPGRWYISDSIQIKSYDHIEISPNAYIEPAEGYTGPIFYMDGPVKWATIDGGYYDGYPNHTYDFIHMRSNGTANPIAYNTFKNLTITYVDEAFRMNTISTGWITENNILNSRIQGPRHGFNLDESATSEGLGGNKVSDVSIEAAAWTTYAVDTITGNGWLFNNLKLWDFASGQYTAVIADGANSNTFIGGSLRGLNDAYPGNFINGGTGTILITDGKVIYPNAIINAAGTVDMDGGAIEDVSGLGTTGARVPSAFIDDLTVTNEISGTIAYSNVTFSEGDVTDPTTYKTYFKIDTTANGPTAGDSLYVDSRLAGYNIEFYRSVTANSGMELQYPQTWANGSSYGYEFDSISGTVTVHPVWITGQKNLIKATKIPLTRWTPPGAAYTAEYDTVYQAMTTKPDEAVASAQNTMVAAFVNYTHYNIWTQWGIFYNFATDKNTAGEALINWARPGTYNATNNGASWTLKQGYLGNGTSAYLSTGWTPASDSVFLGRALYGRNNASIMIYLRVNQTEETANVFGATGSTSRISFIPRKSTDAGTLRLNNQSDQDFTGITDASGLWIVSRNQSDTTKVYHNGLIVDTEYDQSVSLPDVVLSILQRTGHSYWSTNEVALFGVKNKVVGPAEALFINTTVEAYMDDAAIGTGVQYMWLMILLLPMLFRRYRKHLP